MNFEIDPEWAWREFVPGAEAPWNLRTASHLFRRLGFGATQAELDAAIQKSPSEVVDELLGAEEPASFQQEMKSLADSALATGNVKQLSAWWTYRLPRRLWRRQPCSGTDTSQRAQKK